MIGRMEFWIKELEESNPLLADDMKIWKSALERFRKFL